MTTAGFGFACQFGLSAQHRQQTTEMLTYSAAECGARAEAAGGRAG